MKSYEDEYFSISIGESPYSDEFCVSFCPSKFLFTVTRVDRDSGWDQDLKIFAVEKKSGRRKTVRVGPSAINNVAVDLSFNQLIPRHIYICYKTKEIPEFIIDEIKRLNPAHELHVFGDDECRQFLGDTFGGEAADCFSWIPRGEIKADFWRSCVLLNKGGVYFDIDVRHRLGIDDYLEPSATFLTSTSATANHMNPIVIMSRPENPVLDFCSSVMLERFRRNMPFAYWEWSICGTMYRSVKKVVGVEVGNDFGSLISHGEDVYQFLNENKSMGVRTEIFTHWRGTKVLNNHHWAYVDGAKRKGFKPEQRPAENEEFKVEILQHSFEDLFDVNFDGDSLRIRRVDDRLGWGLNMRLEVTYKASGRTRTLEVGPSETNEKVVRIPVQRAIESEKYRVEVVEHAFEDVFDLYVDGDMLLVTRSDADSGWGQNLMIRVIEKPTGREGILEVGPSARNRRIVGISF